MKFRCMQRKYSRIKIQPKFMGTPLGTIFGTIFTTDYQVRANSCNFGGGCLTLDIMRKTSFRLSKKQKSKQKKKYTTESLSLFTGLIR